MYLQTREEHAGDCAQSLLSTKNCYKCYKRMIFFLNFSYSQIQRSTLQEPKDLGVNFGAIKIHKELNLFLD